MAFRTNLPSVLIVPRTRRETSHSRASDFHVIILPGKSQPEWPQAKRRPRQHINSVISSLMIAILRVMLRLWRM
jgi:hypothetical protein